jgi:hypothetical protein
MSAIGKRVRIIGDHPHSGETGVVEKAEITPFGKKGLVIKLDNSPLKVDCCYVFHEKHIQLISK